MPFVLNLSSLKRLLDLDHSLQLDMSLSMSMSMDYIVTKLPTMAPTQVDSKTPHAPSASPTPTVSASSQEPSTVNSSPMAMHTDVPTIRSTNAFQCNKDGTIVSSTPGNMTTKLDLNFSYEAQVNSTTLEDDLLHKLELAFLSTAVKAFLDCDVTTKPVALTEYQHVNSLTNVLGKSSVLSVPLGTIILSCCTNIFAYPFLDIRILYCHH